MGCVWGGYGGVLGGEGVSSESTDARVRLGTFL